MPNPATVEDLQDRFRALTAAEWTFAQALLDDAWTILTTQKPNLESQMAAGDVSEGVVRLVVSAMALRVLRNPEAIKQWSVDDASFTRDGSVAGGLLYASDYELGLLAVPGTGTGAAFTITPSNEGPGYSTALPTHLLGWS